MRTAVMALFALLAFSGCLGSDGEDVGIQDTEETRGPVVPYVVVATLDTGGNLVHPTWQRDIQGHPSSFIDGYPEDAPALAVPYTGNYMGDVNASVPAIQALIGASFPHYVPGTNIIGVWAADSDQIPVFDVWAIQNNTIPSTSHGAQASSQIAGLGFSMAPDAYIVIMDRTSDGGDPVYESNAEGLRWAADQPWIDIIHTNIQNPAPAAGAGSDGSGAPGLEGYPEAVEYAISKGKLVVSAGGNFYAESTETSPHAGPAGVLVAGANDNCGYTDYSNPDPHVVMDGYQTVSAAPDSNGTDTFGGTSSASPRITGYAARLLMDIRSHFNVTTGMQGTDLVRLDEGQAPATGPLADGALTAAELHEIIRKTANPNPHDSMYDGEQGACIPQPADSPMAVYAKMGYGEVSEHTLPHAFAVAVGDEPIPERPGEDAYFGFSETVREVLWGT